MNLRTCLKIPMWNRVLGSSANPQPGWPRYGSARFSACGFRRHPCRQFSIFRQALTTLVLVAAAFGGPPASGQLRDFSALSAWKIKGPGTDLKLTNVDTPYGQGMSFDYDYREAGNFALVRQECDVPLKGNFELSFWMKAVAPDNNIEIKLEDVNGNTYWYRRDAYRWPREWTHIVLRKRLISFAWGPKSSAELSELRSIEFVVSSSGAGRKGVVYLADLRITPLGDYGKFSDPVTEITSDVPSVGQSDWRTTGPVSEVNLDLHLARPVEFGGLEIEWQKSMAPGSYDILMSTNGSAWKLAQTVEKSSGKIDVVFTPDAEGREIRIHAKADSKVIGLERVKLLPPELDRTGAGMLKAFAQSSPHGYYFRHLLNQQAYWTLIGYSGSKDKALLCEDGQIELAKGRPSVDPFVVVDGKVWHWANTEETQGLMDDYLPLPWVERSGPVSLRISGFAVKDNGGTVYACYTLVNHETTTKKATLVLALRPIQVNPEWQHSGVQAEIKELSLTPTSMSFGRDQKIVLLTPADRLGATTFADGEMGRRLQFGDLPASPTATDASGLASGYVAYDVSLKPGESRSFWWCYSIGGMPGQGVDTNTKAAALQSRVAEEWRQNLSSIKIELPASEQHLVNLIRANIAYIEINRDGVRFQPGSRNYKRSWIRDGSLMSAALVHFGVMKPAKEFIEWYTQFVRPSGYVPAIVENDQPLPTLECDAFGEYIYLVAEYWKFNRGVEFARQYYPVVKRVAAYIEKLHLEGQALHRNATGKEALYYGLLTPSISHEGYGSPVHSYWDNYFAILGLKDAAVLATAVGQPEDAAHFLAVAADLRQDVVKSIEAAAKYYKFDLIFSCPDYGEPDASGVAILVNPCDEMSYMPQDLLRNTFDAYYERCVGRADGTVEWSGYTPYEFRNMGVFARLGDKDRALWLLRWFTKDTRPIGWNQWAEVVFQDPRAPVYIGDMPHTWCGAEFVREIRDFFAYEEDLDKSLVFCSGIPEDWLQGRGIQVQDLPTAYGKISLQAATKGLADVYQVTGNAQAPGGIWLVSARNATPKAVTVNGRPVAPAKRIKLASLPAQVEFSY